MKTIRLLFLQGLLFFMIPIGLLAQNIWINEIHYDNAGTDAGEFIEVVLENPGNYTLANFSIVLYNGNNGASYDTKTLDLYTVGATVGNFKFYTFDYTAATLSIQNGAPDGMAVAYNGVVVPGQFLSYEGTLTATDGPASGMTSVDIGVLETSTTPIGSSLQLSGTGSTYSAFAWQPEAPQTVGVINNGQNLGGAPDPEPTNYPTSFAATPSPFTISLSWVDATGGQLPSAYLVLASDQNNIVAPVDGTPVADDANLADGTGALNVNQGTQTCAFTSLPSNHAFYFKIFPYSNAGTNSNFKTDGTPPSANATTPTSEIIDSIHFTNKTFSNWIRKSVVGDQVWGIDSIHLAGNPFASMSGFLVQSNVNEDWLISPAMNFNLYTNEILTFVSAYKYTGDPLQALISNDYDGVTNPGDFTWTPLTAAWSAGNFVWASSGPVSVSGTNGTHVYIGFKYTSTAVASSTWELDDIVITGDRIIGMGEKTANDGGFSVTPNPASGKCSVRFNHEGNKEIRVISVIGTAVLETSTDQMNFSMNLSSLAPGIYFVQVSVPETKSVQVRKLIVQ
jgi:hypothetical protein